MSVILSEGGAKTACGVAFTPICVLKHVKRRLRILRILLEVLVRRLSSLRIVPEEMVQRLRSLRIVPDEMVQRTHEAEIR